MENYTKKYDESTINTVQLQGDLLVFSRRVRVPAGCAGPGLSGRGRVREFSPSSGMRMRRYLRTCCADYGTMVTLTYPHAFPLDGRQSKEHLKRFLQELKRDVIRFKSGSSYVSSSVLRRTPRQDNQEFSAFWFMEFQNRGAFHYHIFCTHAFKKEWIAKKWFDIVGSDDSRHLQAGTRIEAIKKGRGGMSAYASKYAAKMSQKKPPEYLENVGRFWGVAGERKIMVAATSFPAFCDGAPAVKLRWERLKEAVKDSVKEGHIRPIRSKRDGVRLFSVESLSLRDQLLRSIGFLDMQVRLEFGWYGCSWEVESAESLFI